MIYKGIKNILENDSDFLTAIGTDSDGDIKAYPIHPRKEVAVPFCTISITDQRGNPTKDHKSYLGMDEIRVRISCFHIDLDSLVDIAEKCRIAMDNQKPGGTFNGVVIKSIDFESMNDSFNESYGEHGALILDIDYIIWATP